MAENALARSASEGNAVAIAGSSNTQLSVSAVERDLLIRTLETALKNRRVEEHRTRAPNYREQILDEEKILEQLLAKLGRVPA